jgi:integrase
MQRRRPRRGSGRCRGRPVWRVHGLYKTLLRAGGRRGEPIGRGELAGLRWSKVDLVRGVVRTDWQRTRATGQGDHGVVEKETKGTSARNIAIGATLLGLLAARSCRQVDVADLDGPQEVGELFEGSGQVPAVGAQG